MSGCYGNSVEDQYRERELNCYLDAGEWSAKDMNFAKSELYDCISDGGEAWDENLEGYRIKMLYEFEQIMSDRDDDKLGRMRDVQHKCINDYCDEVVEHNPSRYCERFCL